MVTLWANNLVNEEEFAIKLNWLREGHCYFLLPMENVIGNHESKKVYVTVYGHNIFPHLPLNMASHESKEKN